MERTHLRFLGNRRIGGIIVAFTGPDQRDAFGNYWTADTDFCLQRYDRRPLYAQHRGDIVEAGIILSGDMQITSKGLYIECDVLENEAGDWVLRQVGAERGHYSTGVMPGSWIAARDGWVQQWPLVEVSVTDIPATRFGLTRAEHIRSSGIAIGDSQESLWRGPIMPDVLDGGNGTQSVAAAPAVTAPAAPAPAVSDEQLARVMRQVLGEQPTRQLQPAALPEPLRPAAPAAQVQVSHRFDNLSLAALATWGSLRMKMGKLRGSAETELIRALSEKMRKQIALDDVLTDEQIRMGHVRMIDPVAQLDWGRHIRANEAMTSTYDGYGDQLVPTLLNSVLWYHFIMESKLLPSLQKFQLPSVPYDWPVITGGPTIRRVPQLTDQTNFSVSSSTIPTSKITTAKKTFSPDCIGALVLAEETLFEDSATEIAQMWTSQMLRQMVYAIDDVILNGHESPDVNNISYLGTDPTGTVADVYLGVNGLRSFAFTNSDTVAVATLAAISHLTQRALMGTRGRFGIFPDDLLYVMCPGSYYKLLALDTLDGVMDFGERATLVKGTVADLYGMGVVVADQFQNTDANGKIPAAGNGTKGSQIVVRKAGVVFGYARNVTTELSKIPGTQGYFADVTCRFDLQEMEAGQVGLGYNTTI